MGFFASQVILVSFKMIAALNVLFFCFVFALLLRESFYWFCIFLVPDGQLSCQRGLIIDEDLSLSLALSLYDSEVQNERTHKEEQQERKKLKGRTGEKEKVEERMEKI